MKNIQIAVVLCILTLNGFAKTKIYNTSYNLTTTTLGPPYTVNTFEASLGGYIIKVSDDGKHGLVVAMQDQSLSTFFQVLNATNTANNHDADGAAVKGWRIPTLNEAALIVKEHANIGGFTANAFYWTSHSMGDLRYIVVQFDTTPIYSHYPSSTYQARSRVVREF